MATCRTRAVVSLASRHLQLQKSQSSATNTASCIFPDILLNLLSRNQMWSKHIVMNVAPPSLLHLRRGLTSHFDVRNTKGTAFVDDLVAHLLPCGQNLHNECLKPWVERANSCPICRVNFNMGGDKRGLLLNMNDFDNGRCYEMNERPESTKRQKTTPNFAMGPASTDGPDNYPLFCETKRAHDKLISTVRTCDKLPRVVLSHVRHLTPSRSCPWICEEVGGTLPKRPNVTGHG
ncbi:hypothetical protein BDV95DRAFT_603396 [Massariosphaeria phaeospora]|uniref:Uncharacterized protein n=1 Tax=Massariosphaeria phaeospora TaxID=100035 RepID=A0A7C8MEZ5_9PLEO|nr:hypothetical protein BDV95DRAFT_603396 [Massariosphaeria phaeospora]